MSALILRQMTMDDIDATLQIEQSIYPYPWTRGNFTDALNSGYIGKVAELDNKMVGYAVLMPAEDEAHLLTIGIAAEHQGKGLGSELLRKILDLAQSLKMRRIILEVRPSNMPAIALYRKNGFRKIGLRRGYYPADGGREDAIVMERIL